MADSDAEIAKKLNNLKKEAKRLAIEDGKRDVILDELLDAEQLLNYVVIILKEAYIALRRNYSSNRGIVVRKREKIQFQIARLKKLINKIDDKRRDIIMSPEHEQMRKKLIKIPNKAYAIANTLEHQEKYKKVLSEISDYSQGGYASKYSSKKQHERNIKYPYPKYLLDEDELE